MKVARMIVATAILAAGFGATGSIASQAAPAEPGVAKVTQSSASTNGVWLGPRY